MAGWNQYNFMMCCSWIFILTCTYAHGYHLVYPFPGNMSFPSLPATRSSLVYDNYPELPTFGISLPFAGNWENGVETVPSIPIYDPLMPFERRFDDRRPVYRSHQYPLNQQRHVKIPPLSFEMNPPPYYKALQNLDNVTSEIKNRLMNNLLGNNPFITSVYVIQRMGQEAFDKSIRSMQNSLNIQEINYNDLVNTLIRNANNNPQMARDQVNCILDKSHETIRLVRKLLDNSLVHHLCKVQSGCDHMIDSFIKIVDEDELYRQALQLLLLGDEASGYLHMHPQLFDHLQNNDIQTLFMMLVNVIKSIMHTIAMFRQTNPNLLDECSLHDSLHDYA